MIGKIMILFSLVILIISYIIYDANQKLKSQIPQFEELKETGMEKRKCKRINSDYSFEDIFQLNDEFIIASTIFDDIYEFKYYNEYMTKGKIFAFNLKTEELFEIPIKNFPKTISFSPLGIDILNKEFLFVINHNGTPKGSNDRIEIFKIHLSGEKGIELTYEKSIILPDRYFGTLNGVAAIDLNSFYFTTWQVFSLPLKPSIYEKILYKIKEILNMILLSYNIKGNYVYLYDEGKISKLEKSGAIFTNGIVYDSTNKFLFAVRTIEKDILIYKIADYGKEGSKIGSIKTPYSVDNIFFKDNKLYCGINSNLHMVGKIKSAIKEKGNANDISHFSGFMEISLNQGNKITDILLQDKFKCVSSGIKVENKTIMSSFADKGLYVCQEK